MKNKDIAILFHLLLAFHEIAKTPVHTGKKVCRFISFLYSVSLV